MNFGYDNYIEQYSNFRKNKDAMIERNQIAELLVFLIEQNHELACRIEELEESVRSLIAE